jgi:hypothetical protein
MMMEKSANNFIDRSNKKSHHLENLLDLKQSNDGNNDL